MKSTLPNLGMSPPGLFLVDCGIPSFDFGEVEDEVAHDIHCRSTCSCKQGEWTNPSQRAKLMRVGRTFRIPSRMGVEEGRAERDDDSKAGVLP